MFDQFTVITNFLRFEAFYAGFTMAIIRNKHTKIYQSGCLCLFLMAAVEPGLHNTFTFTILRDFHDCAIIHIPWVLKNPPIGNYGEDSDSIFVPFLFYFLNSDPGFWRLFHFYLT